MFSYNIKAYKITIYSPLKLILEKTPEQMIMLY